MPILRAVICACLLAFALAACSETPLKSDVIEQARAGGQISFDVVDLNDNVLATLQAHQPPPFDERFKKYVPAPDLKVSVGDTVSVVIWESGSNGLFGNSLTDLSFPAGATSQLSLTPAPSLKGVPVLPSGVAAPPDLLATLFGGNVPDLTAAARAATGAGAGQGALAPQVEQFLELARQNSHPGTRLPDQQVGPDGGISVPFGGRLKVAGSTPQQVEHLIEQRLAAKALDPKALVVITASTENSVAVSGTVAGARRVPLSPGGDRLLQVIAAAGGATSPVHDTFVQLTRSGVTAGIPLATLVADPAQNIFARPGDVLTLSVQPQTFSVFGATGKNSAITFDADRLSLAEALGKAGGLLDDRADARAVFLFRYEPLAIVRALGQPAASNTHGGVSPVVYRLNLKKAKSLLLARQFPVHDKDVIFVANALSQRVYYFFEALSAVTGPALSAAVTCQSISC